MLFSVETDRDANRRTGQRRPLSLTGVKNIVYKRVRAVSVNFQGKNTSGVTAVDFFRALQTRAFFYKPDFFRAFTFFSRFSIENRTFISRNNPKLLQKNKSKELKNGQRITNQTFSER